MSGEKTKYVIVKGPDKWDLVKSLVDAWPATLGCKPEVNVAKDLLDSEVRCRFSLLEKKEGFFKFQGEIHWMGGMSSVNVTGEYNLRSGTGWFEFLEEEVDCFPI